MAETPASGASAGGADRAGRDTGLAAALRQWFRPPRPHGAVIEDRVVSPLELFYDLVFVVLISQIATTLAEEVTWTGVGHFAVMFTLIWFGVAQRIALPRAPTGARTVARGRSSSPR